MLTTADRAACERSHADRAAVHAAMLCDIGEGAVIAWLQARGYVVWRHADDTPIEVTTGEWPPRGDEDG